ncbi:MAG: family 43 glycosylhydrolase, partial [Prevotella sp.]|nr:family 43 glycosylhydrolase [Prevotella sp.]
MTILTAKAQQGFVNPVHNMRDGCVERHRGYFYIMGEETKGTISRSKDMVSWSNPVKAVTTDGATWLNDPQWTQAYTYKQVQAGDLIYRNGVWHSYFNGIGHCYCDEPQGNYKEQTLTEPFDDYGIDVQVFQDEDGEIYWVKKRNPADPHPMTRAASNIDGPEVWAFRMNSPFSRWDITEGRVQMTHQRGHPTSLNHINFEGPELARYHDKYYIFYAVNRMGPRSGMYQVGCAISDQPMNFNNSKKLPHPVITRNTEQQLIDYKPIAPTAEHGGWDARYTMSQPSGSWTSADYDDSSWKQGQGGFGYQEFDLYSGTTMTNARVRARKTFWKATNIYIRRTFTLDEVPSHMGMKLWVNGTATFYINGHDFKVTSSNNTYSVRMIDPSWLKPGENIVAVAGVSSNTSNTSQQLIDFGFYDTGDED